MHLVVVQILEKITFLPLVVRHVEGVACHVLLLPVEVFHHGQGVVVRTLLHGGCIGHLPRSETALVLYLLPW